MEKEKKKFNYRKKTEFYFNAFFSSYSYFLCRYTSGYRMYKHVLFHLLFLYQCWYTHDKIRKKRDEDSEKIENKYDMIERKCVYYIHVFPSFCFFFVVLRSEYVLRNDWMAFGLGSERIRIRRRRRRRWRRRRRRRKLNDWTFRT